MSSRLIAKCCTPSFRPPTRGNQSNGSKTRLCILHHGSRASQGAAVTIPVPICISECRNFSSKALAGHDARLIINNGRSNSVKLYSSKSPPTPLLHLDTSVGSRHLSRHLANSPNRVTISLNISHHPTLSTYASPCTVGKSSTMKRPFSSSSSPPVSQEVPNGSIASKTSEPPNWQFPSSPRPPIRKTRRPMNQEPLPLPIALKTFRPISIPPATSLTRHTSIANRSQLAFPPPPAVLGSQPLYYLARRFPLLAEQELNKITNKTALDYSSFLQGAMETSYPSATTLRAVLRQFRNFLKDSTRNLKDSSMSSPTVLELPRARIWAQMIRGLIWTKQYRRARVAVHVMQKLRIKPTGYAWRGICRGWIEQGQLDRAEALAAKVFTRPEISHDYNVDEKPYYFTDMMEAFNGSQSNSGRRIHRSPMSPNSAPLFLVIEALAECGEMERARYWFDQIPEQEVTDMLTSDMVAGYLRVGQQDKAQEVIRIMARCGVKPTAIVFNPIVEHATKSIGMEAAEELVQDMIQLGIFLNLFTYKILVRGYIAAGQKDKALECLDRIRASGIEPDRALGRILLDGFWDMSTLRIGDYGPPAVCGINRSQEMKDTREMEDLEFVGKPGWSQRYMGLIQKGDFEQVEEALQLVLDTKPSVLDPEAVEVIKAFADQQEMTRARHWFDHLVASDYVSNHSARNKDLLVGLLNCMVSGYIQNRQRDEAENVIGIMWQHDVRPTVDTINQMLQWSTLQSEMQDAENLVQSMTRSGILPNQQTYDILCQGYASRGALDSLQECLIRMEKAGFGGQTSSPSIKELQISLFGQSDPLATNEGQSDASHPVLPSTSILDTLCKRWIEHDKMEKADRFIDHLLSNPNVPSLKIPYTTLIQGWIDQSQRITVSSSAMEAIAQSRSNSPTTMSESSSVPSSKSLNQEVRLREQSVAKMRKARFWFDKIPETERSLDLVNKMIGGYMALGLEQESEGLVQWMALHKIKPNVTTYNHILEHTIQQLSMPAAEGLISKMQDGGIAPDVDTWNLLIRGYMIRGELSDALQCLDRMAGKKVASLLPKSKRTSQRKTSKSKYREVMETYDQEILDAVVSEEGERVSDAESASDLSKLRTPPTKQRSSVEPNEMTKRLILSGFGPEQKPLQGQGDYSRALALYKSRVERQRQQKEKLLQGLATMSQNNPILPKPRLGAESVGEKEQDEDEWIFDNLDRLGEIVGTDLGMTDLDWKNELKWEELMEIEKERERELSG